MQRNRYDLVNVAAGNMILLRKDFISIGGFKNNLNTAGDSIFFSETARKNKFKILSVENCIVYHPVDDFKRRIRRFFVKGEGMLIKQKYGRKTNYYKS